MTVAVPPPGTAATTPDAAPPAAALLRGWGLLAAGSLAVAGGLALLLALSRTPGAQDLLPWPWQDFFPRALVTHVVFSFVVWYAAMLGALAVLAGARGRGAALGLGVALLGGALLLGVTLANRGAPSLNDYVPVLTHPAYYAGLALVGLGVAVPAAQLLARPGALARPAAFAVAMAALAFLAALLCFAVVWGQLPPALDAATFNQRLFWGGGHVLQFANTALMLAGWRLLAARALGAPLLSRPVWLAALGGLGLFALAAPLLLLVDGPLSLAYRDGFTQLLWYGLALPPMVVMAGLTGLLWRRRATLPWREPAFVALLLSLAVFAVGGVFGFFLGVGDTRTPSHYHAVIGGVNLAMMGTLLALLLPAIGRGAGGGRATRWSFWLYGGGQLLFSAGMFLAGTAGVPRKTAGAEQGLDSMGKVVSMAMTGSGGVIAVVGGVMFVWLALKGLMGRAKAAPQPLAEVEGHAGGRGAAALVAAAMAVLLVAMPAWRSPPAPASGYDADPAAFARQVEAMVAAHATGAEVEGAPVVRPPAGDVYLLARRFAFYPALELRAGETYRLHVASGDIMHGLHGPGIDRLLPPGRAEVIELRPQAPGRLVLKCSEYCGLDHNGMVTEIRILSAD